MNILYQAASDIASQYSCTVGDVLNIMDEIKNIVGDDLDRIIEITKDIINTPDEVDDNDLLE